MIPKMEAAGFRVDFNTLDKAAGRTSPINRPSYAASFIKGALRVWKGEKGWQVAEIICGVYHNHRAAVGAGVSIRGTRSERFVQGWIPTLNQLLELDAANDL